MNKESPTRKGHQDFNIGDMFINEGATIVYYISEKKRYSKLGQFTFILTVLNCDNPITIGKKCSFNTARLNDRIEYWGWKHVPVKK